MHTSVSSNPSYNNILFTIPGVRVGESISIPTECRGVIARCASAARTLLKHFGPFEICQIPQFSHDVMAVSVEQKKGSEAEFDASRFESFVMDVKAALKSAPSRSTDVDESDENEFKDKLESLIKSMAGLGIITIRFENNRTVTLKCGSHSGLKAETYAIHTVESSSSMVMLKHEYGTIVMTANDAKKIKVGDKIVIDKNRNAHLVQRSIGKLRVKQDRQQLQHGGLFDDEGAAVPIMSDG